MQSNIPRGPATGFSRQGRQDSASPVSSSGSTTPPLKIGKGTTAYASSSTLVGGVKGGAPLARRSSASFNHVRTSSLVSSSPFKTGESTSTSSSTAKISSQHGQSQSQHVSSRFGQRSGDAASALLPHLRSKSDENRPAEHIRMPRQSRGFRDLPLAEAVTRSPFIGSTNTSRIPTSRSATLFNDTVDQAMSSKVSKSATYPSLNTNGVTSSDAASAVPRLAPNHTLLGRPLPGTPQKQARPVSMSIIMDSPASTSPITRSNLVSRRLIGPRSPEGSSSNRNSFVDSPTRRERRKTVTWDERCDVVEFEQDDEETRTVSSVSDNREARESETESEQEDVIEIPQPTTEQREWFGPDREEGRSPSPILSGSINDAMDDLDNASTMQVVSDDETPTPQREVIDLPVDDSVHQENSVGPMSAINTSMSNLFLGDGSTFRDDSMSTQDDSFHRELRAEREVETSLKFSETRSPERFPRISRDAIRRQVEQQKLGSGGSDIDLNDHHPRSRTSMHEDEDLSINERSFATASFKRFEYSPAASPGPRPHSEQIFSSSFHGNRSDVNIEDVHSALDRLMLGVEKNFEPSVSSGVSDRNDEEMYNEQEEDETASNEHSFAQQSYGQQPTYYEEETPVDDDIVIGDGADLHRQSTAMSGGSTESTDGPETPHMHNLATPEPFTDHKDLPYEDESKPLPPPPIDSPQSPVQVLETIVQEQVGPTLAVPTTPTVRRGSTIKRHEEAIKAKRREQRAMEGRPSRRRSQSTGDLKAQLDEPDKLELDNEGEVELTDAVHSELAKRNPTNKKSYMMKQRRPTIYASDSRVGHMGTAGDVHGGRAWRAVRRPSDMNEYSKQIRQIRNQEKPGLSTGKVFVRVLEIRELDIPLPTQPTYFTCVLNNGIHFVETPASSLEQSNSVIDAEFELIEHEKLEFTLTIKVRKDAHIAQIMNPPPRAFVPPIARVETPTKSRGMRSFFSSPSKKPSKQPVIREEPPPLVQTADPFGRYLKKDLSIARALVSFKDIVDRCNAKLLETSYPLVGQCSNGSEIITKTVGEIVLQIFRLPALPGIPPQDLPQSLDECDRGLRHVKWHKVVYHEGVLTQLGGDCTTWRRRNLRVMGANLIAYNDVTKKPITTMDIRKITLVEEEPRPGAVPTVIRPPSEDVNGSLNAPKLKRQRSFNALAGIEHSFRVVFDGNENDELCFFADTAQEKTR
ncbi:Bud site selection protein bud4, partial [Serendipita sp. 399]